MARANRCDNRRWVSIGRQSRVIGCPSDLVRGRGQRIIGGRPARDRRRESVWCLGLSGQSRWEPLKSPWSLRYIACARPVCLRLSALAHRLSRAERQAKQNPPGQQRQGGGPRMAIEVRRRPGESISGLRRLVALRTLRPERSGLPTRLSELPDYVISEPGCLSGKP